MSMIVPAAFGDGDEMEPWFDLSNGFTPDHALDFGGKSGKLWKFHVFKLSSTVHLYVNRMRELTVKFENRKQWSSSLIDTCIETFEVGDEQNLKRQRAMP